MHGNHWTSNYMLLLICLGFWVSWLLRLMHNMNLTADSSSFSRSSIFQIVCQNKENVYGTFTRATQILPDVWQKCPQTRTEQTNASFVHRCGYSDTLNVELFISSAQTPRNTIHLLTNLSVCFCKNIPRMLFESPNKTNLVANRRELSARGIQEHERHTLCNISSTDLSRLLPLTFNPFDEGKQPLCWRWTQNLSSKPLPPAPLMCQL